MTRLKNSQYAATLLLTLLVAAPSSDAVSQGQEALKGNPQAGAKAIGVTAPRGSQSKASLLINNLTNHGGPVITSAKVVFIFWGPNFSNAASPDFLYAQELQSFRNQFGTTPEYNVITQYSGIQRSNLGTGTADWFDTSLPPTNVTDALVRSKVTSYLTTHAFDANTIYEVVLPITSYASFVDSQNVLNTSCSGPNVRFCAYHSAIGSGASATKYSSQPYPSCGGCQVFGWTAAQNEEHFVTHETRETVTDPLINAWYDGSDPNNPFTEADDKCAWTPAPFLGTGGYGYQYEWSNAASACVQSVAIPPPPPPGNPFTYISAADQRQACYGMASHVSSYCDSIVDFNDRQMCYGLAQSSQTPCTQITDRNLQLTCYGIAVKPNWPSNCRDITDANMKAFCYGAAGVAITDIGQCTPITVRDTQLLCYAMNDFISSNCRDISTTNDRQFCYGVSGHDTSYCATIQ